MEKLGLEFYAFDKEFDVSIIDEIKIGKYLKLKNFITDALFEKSKGAYSLQTNYIQKFIASNYEIYHIITLIITNHINNFYNKLLEKKSSRDYKQGKTHLMNIIKLETARLLDLKKHMKKIGDSSISPEYINNLIKAYDLDDEECYSIVFSNIHNLLNKIFYDGYVNKNTIVDLQSLSQKMLKQYEISEEVKQRIASIYSDKNETKEDSNSNVIDFEEYKKRKLLSNALKTIK